MRTLLSFIEQNPNFSEQEVMQAHVLQNAMINKKQACTEQGDIRKFFKKMISANSQESVASTSGIYRDGTTEAKLLEDKKQCVLCDCFITYFSEKCIFSTQAKSKLCYLLFFRFF
jgi:hypothetical protein